MNDLRIVKISDFKGELLIVGYENPQSGICQDLTAAIEKYEPMYLSSILGYGFYQYIMDTIEADPENVPDEIVALIDGADFFYNGMLYYWEGLRQHTAQFIYYWYNRNVLTQTTGLGQMIPKAENGQLVSMSQKMMDAYNRSQFGAIRCREYLSTVEWPDPQPPLPVSYARKFDFMNIFGL